MQLDSRSASLEANNGREAKIEKKELQIELQTP
jgi:hypothetical protein